jgi:hypothetical protein
MMANVINFIDTSSGCPSLTFRKSQLLAVQAFRDELGSQDALLLQVAWFQISNFAEHSGDEF